MAKSNKYINWCRFDSEGAGIEESYGYAQVKSLSDIERTIAAIPQGAKPMFFIENKEVSLDELKEAIA